MSHFEIRARVAAILSEDYGTNSAAATNNLWFRNEHGSFVVIKIRDMLVPASCLGGLNSRFLLAPESGF